jgi:hypothetical protein
MLVKTRPRVIAHAIALGVCLSTALPAQESPQPRSCATLSPFDAAPAGVVLYGGASGPCGARAIRDTTVWLWDGESWKVLARVSGPGPREDVLLAYDSRRESLLLYGGRDGATVHQDTWIFRSGVWRQVDREAGPGPLEHAAIAYDPERQRFVVFGGGSRDNPTAPSAATWEWDGSRWARLTTADAPPARVGHSMTWSDAHRGVVLYGGFSPTSSFRDLWRWNGATWARLDSLGPVDTEGPSLAETRRGLVLIAAMPGTQPAGVAAWLYAGGAWSPLAAPGPPLGIGQTMAFDSRRQRLVLFGGWRERESRPSAEVWELEVDSPTTTWSRKR